MEAIVLVGLLAGVVYYVLGLKPAVAQSVSPSGSLKFSAIRTALSTGWPRHAVLFAASLVIAWFVVNSVVSVWLGIAAKLGQPLNLSPSIVTLIVLGAGGIALYRTNSLPNIKAFAQQQWNKVVDSSEDASATSSARAPEELRGKEPHLSLAQEEISETACQPSGKEIVSEQPVRNGDIRTILLFFGSLVAGWYVVSRYQAGGSVEAEPEMAASADAASSFNSWWIVGAVALAFAFWYWTTNKSKSESAATPQEVTHNVERPSDEGHSDTGHIAKRYLPKWGLAAAGAAAMALAVVIYHPTILERATAWANSTIFGPEGEETIPETQEAVAATDAVPEGAEEVVIDRVVQELVDHARIARLARESITADLSIALAAAERNGQSDEANRLRTTIAAKEQAVVDARQAARDSLALIAEAFAANPAIVTQALVMIEQQGAVKNDPKGALLVQALKRVGGIGNEYINTGMVAWEQAAAIPVLPVAAGVPTSIIPATQAAMPEQSHRDAPSVSASPERARSSSGRPERRPSNDPWNRDRQRYYGPDSLIPEDEFQR